MPAPSRAVCPHCQAPLPGEPGARLICPACGREAAAPGPTALGASSLAGSADDRAVTLPAASADATTLTAQGRGEKRWSVLGVRCSG